MVSGFNGDLFSSFHVDRMAISPDCVMRIEPMLFSVSDFTEPSATDEAELSVVLDIAKTVIMFN